MIEFVSPAPLEPTHFTERALTEKQAAEMFGLSPATLRAWRSTGRVGQPPHIVLGSRSIRYLESQCIAWLAAQTDGSEVAA